MKKYKFYVRGAHCKSCQILLEDQIASVAGTKTVSFNLSNNCLEANGDYGTKSDLEVLKLLDLAIKGSGYSLSFEPESKVNWKDFYWAIPFFLGFVLIFIALQKMGLVNLISSANTGYGTAFVVGLVASVSTCMAVVGGLVLSVSSSFAKGGDRFKPQMYFHVGRLLAFFFLGGTIGILGSMFQLGITGTFVLGLLVSLVLLILGVNLLDIFPTLKKWQPTLPNFVSAKVNTFKKMNHFLTPLLLGVATFFLPCGFTQSMQVYALKTGSFWVGGMTMLVFALGTLPVLALLSFSSFSIKQSSWSGIFFKTIGLVVIFFALINLISSLTAVGLINPILIF